MPFDSWVTMSGLAPNTKQARDFHQTVAEENNQGDQGRQGDRIVGYLSCGEYAIANVHGIIQPCGGARAGYHKFSRQQEKIERGDAGNI